MKRIRGLFLTLLFLLVPAMLFAQSIVVSWTANTDDAIGYKVYYGTATGVYGLVVNVGNTTNYTIAGVSEKTTYYIALTAYDAAGNESDKSIEVSTTTLDLTAPTIPGTPTVVGGAKALTISWTAVAGTDLAGYRVYYGTAAGVYGTPVTVGNVLTYTITGLLENTTYYVKISAYDTAGNESARNATEVSAKTKDTTPPTKPAAPTLKVIE